MFHARKVIVVDKPGGLLTQAPAGIDSLELRIKRWRRQQGTLDSNNYLGVPHRLDRAVSGLMLFATSKPVTKNLCQQFEQRSVEKTYWALVTGCVKPSKGDWVDWMRKRPDGAKSEIVDLGAEGGQLAKLSYQVKLQSDSVSLLEIKLETGRTHQIRLQAACREHPILGDDLYGSTIAYGPQTSDLRLRWIALMSKQLAFTHPETEERLEFDAEPSEWWQMAVKNHFS